MSSDLINIIIDADRLFGTLVLDGVRKDSEHEPIAQNTTLGWILSGPIASFPTSESFSTPAHHGVIIETLDRDLRRFWESRKYLRELRGALKNISAKSTLKHTFSYAGRTLYRSTTV